MARNCKNYKTDGGDTLVIGGKLEVLDGATVAGITGVSGTATATVLGGVKAAAKGAGDTVEVKINSTTSKLYVPTYPEVPEAPGEATAEVPGLVLQAANVAEAAGEAPTAAEFKALLDALIAAGIMAAGE